MAEETTEARRMWLTKPPAVYGSPATPPVIAWGVNACADRLCRLTAERDSARRPVAVRSRGNLTWNVHHCGVLEYLVGLFRGEFDDMWADAEGVRRFVHVREAQRLLAIGIGPDTIDPDTGEPDPYAGMSGPAARAGAPVVRSRRGRSDGTRSGRGNACQDRDLPLVDPPAPNAEGPGKSFLPSPWAFGRSWYGFKPCGGALSA
ncbi:hypothetical protein [Streptomyces spiralis]|uniref:hypothetical protein n=1 Tax=Streptomyces spiralis TaxID=66376 RepID=UPI00368502E1